MINGLPDRAARRIIEHAVRKGDIIPGVTTVIEKTGGRGIFLIKHLSDDVKFEEGGKKTILSFYMD